MSSSAQRAPSPSQAKHRKYAESRTAEAIIRQRGKRPEVSWTTVDAITRIW